MAVKKVDLYVTQLIEDLNNGLTWNKKDDLGYGSIEVKYGANEKQIAAIRKHPLLKDAETNIVTQRPRLQKQQNQTSYLWLI
jgi:basic membrane lipoprotein Med (substrate-binding protein (PBP1-ABC) superfamily)